MATINGSNNDDVLTGTAQADTIRGLAGADEIDGGYGDDWIEGGDGDDTLFGGYGTDTLVGGAGDDTYYIDLGSATDRVSEQRDGGFDIVISESSYTLSGNVEGLYLLGGSKGVGNSSQNDRAKSAKRTRWRVRVRSRAASPRRPLLGDSLCGIALPGGWSRGCLYERSLPEERRRAARGLGTDGRRVLSRVA